MGLRRGRNAEDCPVPCVNGQCCRGDEYCGGNSEQCETCFPLGIGKPALLPWCQKHQGDDGTQYRNPSCHARQACAFRFKGQLETSGLTRDAPMNGNTAVLATVVPLVVIVLIAVLLVCYKKGCISRMFSTIKTSITFHKPTSVKESSDQGRGTPAVDTGRAPPSGFTAPPDARGEMEPMLDASSPDGPEPPGHDPHPQPGMQQTSGAVLSSGTRINPVTAESQESRTTALYIG